VPEPSSPDDVTEPDTDEEVDDDRKRERAGKR
jgi:hypothetical protein